MVQINFAQKTVNAKVVYYGPGMSGKTTNLEVIHQKAPNDNRGDLTSISTDGDRTLFFDYMPLDLGTVAGMRTCFQLYTVPGQVYYNSTRKLVLQGVDGVVFVADSSAAQMAQNLESLKNLEENLNEYGKSLANTPFVIQYNKRDIADALSVEELNKALNPHGVPHFEAQARTGQGVFPTLKALAALVLKAIAAESAGIASAPAAALPQQRPAARSAAAAAMAPQAVQAAVAGSQTGFYRKQQVASQGAARPAAAPGMGQTGFYKPGQAAPGAAQPARRPAAPAQPGYASYGAPSAGRAPAQPRAQAPAPARPAPKAAPKAAKKGSMTTVAFVGLALAIGGVAALAVLQAF
jgi:signal recognition particle receptor subunit beta